MSVRKLSDGRWICEFPPGKDTANPTCRRKYFGRGSEGERAAYAENDRMGLGVRKIQRSPTFVELATSYRSARAASIAKSTAENFDTKMHGVVLPAIGNEMAHNITSARLDRYVNDRLDAGVKTTTIHRELSDIRAVLRWAHMRKLISSNPMEGFEMPKRDDARISPPTRAEFEAILACAVPHVQRAMLISWNTGLRPGKEELLTLTWDSVDFENETLTVVSAVKGGLPVRIVPINKTLLGYLRNWYRADKVEGYRYLVNYNGYGVDKINKAWTAAKKRAKITRRLRMYDIRHAFTTTLLERGGDLKSVSEMIGHKSIEMTAEVYQHVSNALKRRTIDLLD